MAFIFLLLVYGNNLAQSVGVNEDGSSPNAASILDIKSQDKGILIPRMTTIEKLAIQNPIGGLMVFDTDEECFSYYKSSISDWVSLCGDFISTPACGDNPSPNINPCDLQIGDQYGGGIVFWKDPNDCSHGKVVSLVDLSQGHQWAEAKMLVGNANSLDDGLTNTANIVYPSGPLPPFLGMTAAELCDTYQIAGFGNWYLPALNELIEVFNNHVAINQSLQNINCAAGLAVDTDYWTSTEVDKDYARSRRICTGSPCLQLIVTDKLYNGYVRAVRQF